MHGELCGSAASLSARGKTLLLEGGLGSASQMEGCPTRRGSREAKAAGMAYAAGTSSPTRTRTSHDDPVMKPCSQRKVDWQASEKVQGERKGWRETGGGWGKEGVLSGCGVRQKGLPYG